MKQLISKITDRIFHPLLMPLYGSILPFLYTSIYFAKASESFRFLLLITLSTYLFPVLVSSLFKISEGKWHHFSWHKLRLIPYLLSAFFTIVLLFFFAKIGIPFWYISLLMASTVVVLFTALSRVYWGLCESLIGIGGIIGAMMCVCYFLKGENPFVLFSVAFLVAGLVGSLQLFTGRYKPWQVYAGFASGWLLAFASIFAYIYMLIHLR